MLENESHVKLWMINNQFSRRNLPTETRLALAYKFKEFEAEKARTRKLSTLQQFSEPKDNIQVFETPDRSPVTYREEESDETNDNEGKTLETVAKKAGVSYGTAFQYDAIQRKGTEEQKLF